jgi:hypothetical protein
MPCCSARACALARAANISFRLVNETLKLHFSLGWLYMRECSSAFPRYCRDIMAMTAPDPHTGSTLQGA